jgi:transcriptional regulator with XRE-family HTH domain
MAIRKSKTKSQGPMRSSRSPAGQYLEELNRGPITFGQLVEAHRSCDQISQAELARRMGMSRAQLCDIEKGRRTVSAERAAQFAKVLGYSVPTFVERALEDQLRRSGLKMRVRLEAA